MQTITQHISIPVAFDGFVNVFLYIAYTWFTILHVFKCFLHILYTCVYYFTGKVDYSNQLLVLSDEWELDPCRLKFCTPIGQGAFGKVVTGYYDNKRVAIKLVRGNLSVIMQNNKTSINMSIM